MNKEDVKIKFINLVDIAIYKSNDYYDDERKDLEDIIGGNSADIAFCDVVCLGQNNCGYSKAI